MTELHSAQLVVCLRRGGKVKLELSQATAAELLDWMKPVLAYLGDRAFEEAKALAEAQNGAPSNG